MQSPPNLIEDAKRVVKFVSRVGVVAAFVCHLFPAHYRPVCDAIDHIVKTCTGG